MLYGEVKALMYNQLTTDTIVIKKTFTVETVLHIIGLCTQKL